MRRKEMSFANCAYGEDGDSASLWVSREITRSRTRPEVSQFKCGSVGCLRARTKRCHLASVPRSLSLSVELEGEFPLSRPLLSPAVWP